MSRAFGVLLSVAFAVLFLAASAAADTPFGGDPSQAVTPGGTCEAGAPPYFHGASSCLWFWLHINVGSDFVPIPVTGGTGVITSVTLPAMPNPGPMQVVILTGVLQATNEPSRPRSICCQVKQIGPTFTVPPNQITTVPQSLPVAAQKEANLEHPGEMSTGDIAAISVLSPTASIPVKYTGQTSLNSTDGGDFGSAYFPAPSAPEGEFKQPTDPGGYQMLARFTMGATPAPAPVPGPPALGGVKLGNGLKVGADGKTVTLGNATNPPTATTTQTLTAPTGARISSTGLAAKKKPVVYGSGKTTVAAGKTVPVKLKLNGKARTVLRKKHVLKATLTVVATNLQGEPQTTTETVKIKSGKAKHKK